ncbi:MAG: hypothetical protein QM655_02350 [Nocardioidaceae bacterium]
MTQYRCPTCGVALRIKNGRTHLAHATWCRWAPRPKPAVVVLTTSATHDNNDTEKENQ